MSATPRDRLLTTREVAELLGISPEAVLRRWRRRELPGFRLSSKVLRFPESELLAWVESKREGPRNGSGDVVGLCAIDSRDDEEGRDAG